jgi:hypothetical protein
MSIFSRLLKRGPEEGEPATTERPQGAAAPPKPAAATTEPAPATRAAPAPAPVAPPAAPEPKATVPARTAAARPEPKTAAPAAKKPALAVTKLYNEAAKPAPAAGSNGAAHRAARPAAAAPRAAAPEPARPAATTPAAPAPAVPVAQVREDSAPDGELAVPGSLDQAFEKLFPSSPAPPAAPAAPAAAEGTSTASDRKAVLATFEELAVGHAAQVRSVMLEVRWGEAQTSWIELARPALKSMRAMSAQIEHAALTAALDGFDAALAALLQPGAPPTLAADARDKLLAAYAPLVAAMPRAFELDGERDRREPIVVRALLAQVAELDPMMIDKLMAAGLGRLEALFRARADEMAAVAGLPAEVAAATAARVQAFRAATPAALATPDVAAAARELAALYATLEADHRAFEDAAAGWSSGDREAKKRLRRKREVSFLEITIALARLGEADLALRLERLPFARRLEELERLVSRMASARLAAPPSPSLPSGTEAPAPEYDEIEIERRMDSSAHAAP